MAFLNLFLVSVNESDLGSLCFFKGIYFQFHNKFSECFTPQSYVLENFSNQQNYQKLTTNTFRFRPCSTTCYHNIST